MQTIFLSAVLLFFLLLWYFIRQIRKKRRSALYYKYWRNIVGRHVEDPFGERLMETDDIVSTKKSQKISDSLKFETTTMGDLFVESNLSSQVVKNLLDSYGVLKISNSWNISTSPTTKAIKQIVKSTKNALDGFGIPIEDIEEIPSLVPGSPIRQISDFVQYQPKLFSNDIKSFFEKEKGKKIANWIKKQGMNALFKEQDVSCFDFYVPISFFQKKNILNFPQEAYYYQVKAVNSESSIQRHFREYFERGFLIPVTAPDYFINQFSNHTYAQFLFPFSSFDIDDYETIFKTTTYHIQTLANEQFGYVKQQKKEISKFTDSTDSLVNSIVNFPVLAFTISGTIFMQRNYKIIQNEKVKIPNAVIKLTSANSFSGIKTRGDIDESNFDSLKSSVFDFGTELSSDTFHALKDSIVHGLAYGDVYQLSAGTILTGLGAAIETSQFVYTKIKKGFLNFNFRFRTRKARKLHKILTEKLEELASYFKSMNQKLKKQCEFNIYGPYYKNIRERFNSVNSEFVNYNKEMKENRKVKLFPPIYYFFVEYAVKRLKIPFNKLRQSRGQIVDDYENSVYSNQKLGAFLCKYHKTSFHNIKGKHNNIIKTTVKVAKDFQNEIKRLREKGVIIN